MSACTKEKSQSSLTFNSTLHLGKNNLELKLMHNLPERCQRSSSFLPGAV